MLRATWNGAVLAVSADTVVLKGDHYFPIACLNGEYFAESECRWLCRWKGEARYFDIVVNGRVSPAAAWYYPDPPSFAGNLRGRVAFWNGVQVEDDGRPAKRQALVARWLGSMRSCVRRAPRQRAALSEFFGSVEGLLCRIQQGRTCNG